MPQISTYCPTVYPYTYDMISVVTKNKAHRKKHDKAVNATASNSKADRKCGNLPYSFLYFPDYCINTFLPKNTLLQSTNC